MSKPPRPVSAGMLPDAAQTWRPIVTGHATDALALRVAGVIRRTVLDGYAELHPGDRRPVRAIEAAEAWLREPSEARALHAAAVAKACTHARKDTLGFGHRVAEAARALATSVTRTADAARRRDLFEALASVEEELIARHWTAGEHGREADVRARLVALLTEP